MPNSSTPSPEVFECHGIAGLLFGHQYEPRYSEREAPRALPPVKDMDWFVWAYGVEGVRDLSTLTSRIYHGDVCVRCGHTRNVQEEPTDGMDLQQ